MLIIYPTPALTKLLKLSSLLCLHLQSSIVCLWELEEQRAAKNLGDVRHVPILSFAISQETYA